MLQACFLHVILRKIDVYAIFSKLIILTDSKLS